MIWETLSIDYSELCYEISKDERFQDIAMKQWAVWFGGEDEDVTTELGKQMKVMYWLDECRKEGILKVYDGARRPATSRERCFTEERRYFVEKRDFEEFCNYVGEASLLAESKKNIKDDKKKITGINKFTSFQNLHANQISLVMMNGGKAKIVINGKPIDIVPSDLELKENQQGWKLLEGAAIERGNLAPALERLNKTSDLEKETTKIKSIISRLNKKLKLSMGLENNPIIYQSGYRFIFSQMTHEDIHGSNVTKGADAMDYLDENEFNEQNHFNKDDHY